MRETSISRLPRGRRAEEMPGRATGVPGEAVARGRELYLGLAAVSAAALAYEIVLTRLSAQGEGVCSGWRSTRASKRTAWSTSTTRPGRTWRLHASATRTGASRRRPPSSTASWRGRSTTAGASTSDPTTGSTSRPATPASRPGPKRGLAERQVPAPRPRRLPRRRRRAGGHQLRPSQPAGFDWEPGSGRLIASEHGETGFDEINQIEGGANYGWPEVEGPDHGDFTAPIVIYEETIAPSGAMFVSSKWRSGSLPARRSLKAYACGSSARTRIAFAPMERVSGATKSSAGPRDLARLVRAAGVRDARVLEAVRSVPRAAFVPPERVDRAYRDAPIEIPHDQVTTQPSLVARMLEALTLESWERVLEVGTGYGFQTALLTRLAGEVISVERFADLAAAARANLASQGITGFEILVADGSGGLPARAPFDAILVSAAFTRVPPPLVEQLAPTGRLVQPIGPGGHDEVVLFERTPAGLERRRSVTPAHFVRLYGTHGFALREY